MTSALPAAPATTSADAGGIEQLRAAFDRVPGYLNAASLGLPPRAVTAAMTEAVAAWTAGRGCPVEYDASVNESRELYARLVGVPAGHVAVGSQVSVFAGLVAASLPDGAEVVCVDGDFSSMVYPFMVHADRGVTVRHVPLAELPDALTERTTMVAFSLAQSACGSLADGDAVVAAARRVGALTFCDLTQAAGWMPVDAAAFDLTVCSAYKWLCAPRGTAFLTVAPGVVRELHRRAVAGVPDRGARVPAGVHRADGPGAVRRDGEERRAARSAQPLVGGAHRQVEGRGVDRHPARGLRPDGVLRLQ